MVCAKNNVMHVPKESMVIALGSNNSVSSKAQLVCALSTCSNKKKKLTSKQTSLTHSLQNSIFVTIHSYLIGQLMEILPEGSYSIH